MFPNVAFYLELVVDSVRGVALVQGGVTDCLGLHDDGAAENGIENEKFYVKCTSFFHVLSTLDGSSVIKEMEFKAWVI